MHNYVLNSSHNSVIPADNHDKKFKLRINNTRTMKNEPNLCCCPSLTKLAEKNRGCRRRWLFHEQIWVGVLPSVQNRFLGLLLLVQMPADWVLGVLFFWV
ncbi:hypothetical protein SLEP1_g25952 [Rubroshorea leprosula]|uniref:Uncharacterized protein n=1 Tax=Rubroshorea leprosula TaxID=152421 RepID=A0AAV5JWS8_9ROSI|nr:hypothetical protein SLEP1_g25952 [Rubroshorea leprosula]